MNTQQEIEIYRYERSPKSKEEIVLSPKKQDDVDNLETAIAAFGNTTSNFNNNSNRS